MTTVWIYVDTTVLAIPAISKFLWTKKLRTAGWSWKNSYGNRNNARWRILGPRVEGNVLEFSINKIPHRGEFGLCSPYGCGTLAPPG
jgi:hypothetical protein